MGIGPCGVNRGARSDQSLAGRCRRADHIADRRLERLDLQARCQFDIDVIGIDLHHLADETTAGQHLIALLERFQQPSASSAAASAGEAGRTT
jgi:hypothetical protein